jgi:hypothetical protein
MDAVSLLAKSGTTTNPLQLLSAIAWQSDESSGIHLQEDNGWLIVSLDDRSSAISPTNDALARRTAN